MRILLVFLAMGSLAGCSLVKGTMLDGQLCTLATDTQVQGYIKTITTAAVPPEHQVAAMHASQLAKLGATALCEAARQAQAREVAAQK